MENLNPFKKKNDKGENNEKCGKCGKSDYAVATDHRKYRYCKTSGCGNVWAPKSIDQLKLDKLKDHFDGLAQSYRVLRDFVEATSSLLDQAIDKGQTLEVGDLEILQAAAEKSKEAINSARSYIA
jgi:hypothetical protein